MFGAVVVAALTVLLRRRPPRYYAQDPPRSKDHPLKPITFHERKPKSLRRENARKYKLLFGILEERRTVDEENGEIHVALLLLCPLIVKCNSLWVLRLA